MVRLVSLLGTKYKKITSFIYSYYWCILFSSYLVYGEFCLDSSFCSCYFILYPLVSLFIKVKIITSFIYYCLVKLTRSSFYFTGNFVKTPTFDHVIVSPSFMQSVLRSESKESLASFCFLSHYFLSFNLRAMFIYLLPTSGIPVIHLPICMPGS